MFYTNKDERLEREKKAHEFERYVLNLLHAEASEQGKILLTGNELGREYSFADGFAPEGLYHLPGPLFIEIRTRFNERFFDYFNRLKNFQFESGSFIFIFGEGKIPTDKIITYVWERFPTFQAEVFDKERISDLAKGHPEAALAFNSQYLEPAISAYKSRDEQKLQNQHIASLRSAYQDDRLALFLGAGVSKSANYPEWNELIKRISLTMFDDYSNGLLPKKDKEDIYTYFQKEIPPSPIIVARILQNSLKDKFPDKLKKQLYDGTLKSDTSDLVREIGTLCMPKRNRLGIVGVVNYNFDDLLETELDNRGVSYRVVVCESDEPSKSELPIYHVHGYLPRTSAITSTQRDALVFSEDAYHHQFLDPYLWTNITQLNLLRNNVCLFIGLSLTDPNQRRLLEVTVSKKPGSRHYAILRDHWMGKNFATLSPQGQELAKIFKGLEESSFINLGISVLWFKDFDDIPLLLRQINS
jgi:hypothetical protein